jgi:Ca2+-binding RTX toxin-like protein
MAIFNGSPARDVYNGTSSADTAHGNGGDDTLNGLGGNDSLYGDSGNDGLYGGIGNDRIFGGSAVDALFGQDGADQLYGEAGNDWLQGGAGNDYLHGGSGNDSLRGDDGDDTLNGAGGDNDLRGGAGNDTLIHSGIDTSFLAAGNGFYDGGSGRDALLIDYQGDYVFSSTDRAAWVELNINPDAGSTMTYADDPVEGFYEVVARFAGIEEFRLTGENARLSVVARTDATVIGNDQNDKLEGRQGDQDFTGGAGADQYQFYWRKGFERNDDTVHGFSVAEGDRIYFGNQSESDYGSTPAPLRITAEEVGGHTIYTSVEVATGQVVHTLDVDAVGLPEPEPWYYLG